MTETEVWDSLYDAFASILDPRIQRSKHQSLIDSICIAMCAVMCGADSWVAGATFGKAKHAWLKRYLALPHGIPSHDTFGRVFAARDAEPFQQHFIDWVHAIWLRDMGEVVTVDGKTLRGSHDRTSGKAAIHLVSVWAHHRRLVLAQRVVEPNPTRSPLSQPS